MPTTKLTGAEQLLTQELQDLYDAEKQLVRALPKMAKAASDEELQNALKDHLEVTKGQVQRIEEIFQSMDMRAKSKPCRGMSGIVEEGQEVIADDLDPAQKDTALVAAGRRVEHYEMAAYASLRDMARQMGRKEAVQMLEETLREELEADKQLAQIGKRLLKEATRQQPAESGEDESGGAASRSRGKSSSSKAASKSGGTSKKQSAGGQRRQSSATQSRRSSRVLTDTEEIREWAEERGAEPACVKGTGDSEDVGMIRLNFPGYSGEESLQPIDWDEWAQKFEESSLALLVEDTMADGKKSNFNKLVSRSTAESAGTRGGKTR